MLRIMPEEAMMARMQVTMAKKLPALLWSEGR